MKSQPRASNLKQPNSILRVGMLLLAGCVAMHCQVASGVIVSSGNGNTDAASLAAAGGPTASQPGFANVGSTGSATVVYLQNRWVLTTAHISLGSSVSFGGNSYSIDPTSVQQLYNSDGTTPTDLKMFRLTTDPGLPAITASYLSNALPSGRQIMIGNGLNIDGSQLYWHIDKTVSPWVWSLQSPPLIPGSNDASGFHLTGPNTIRWGENNVLNTGVVTHLGDGTTTTGYTTSFDDLLYSLTLPLTHEAQGSSGDSGGAVFTKVGTTWVLAGIMFSVSGPQSGQPSSTTVFSVPGNSTRTNIVDLSLPAYRNQILAISVPEPSSLALAAFGGLAGGLLRWRRARNREIPGLGGLNCR
jgi:hypothetical protein